MDTVSRTRDEWMALRCQAGEPRAFDDLVTELERPLRYYAAKLLGNDDGVLDVLQDVWLRVFKNIRRLEDPGSVRAWLYRLTHGVAVDRVRASVSRERAEDSISEAVPESAEPEFSGEDADAVHRALDELELRFREVLTLHFLEDFSIGEIAQVVGCPEGTVKSRIYYAKKAMKEILLRGGYGK